DVLMAMKDYPEAQEILQSLGRKRLMEARHTTSKSGSSGSSKRGSPLPNRDGVFDEKNAKKIVSRIRSDVSAIRNAFRRSKGTTKRISGRSGSDSSAGGARGVLKRMARVTSDEMNQTVSPGRVPSNEETQGVLGAGLPLLQRLKLLKEKEEKEDRERQRLKVEEDAKQQKQQEPPKQEEEHEVIGAGLPLFARLKLLKAKEEKERMDRELLKAKEEKEKMEMEDKERTERENADQQKEVSTNLPDAVSKKVTSPVTSVPVKTPQMQQETHATKDKSHLVDAKPRPTGLLKSKLRAAVLTSPGPITTTAAPAGTTASETETHTPVETSTTQSAPTKLTHSLTIVRSPITA
ncbi:hypothetical protein OTU49_002248, partial [Cherax quadricarinatus]